MGFGRSPLAVRTGLGSSSSCLTPGTIQFPGDPLVELGSSSEFVRAFAARAPSPLPPPEWARAFREHGIRLSWVSFSLERNDAGCPFSPQRQLSCRRGGRGSPGPRRCRPQGSCPSRRFWLRSRIVRTPRGARRFPWRPDASRPCSVPLASLESPFRAFPSRGAVPAFAGLCFLVGSRSTAARRDVPRAFPGLSPPSRPFATACPEARRTHGPGRTVPASVEGARVAASSPSRTRRARR